MLLSLYSSETETLFIKNNNIHQVEFQRHLKNKELFLLASKLTLKEQPKEEDIQKNPLVVHTVLFTEESLYLKCWLITELVSLLIKELYLLKADVLFLIMIYKNGLLPKKIKNCLLGFLSELFKKRYD